MIKKTKDLADDKEWETIDEVRVVDKYLPAGFFTDGILTYKTQYIIRNKKTGEIKRV